MRSHLVEAIALATVDPRRSSACEGPTSDVANRINSGANRTYNSSTVSVTMGRSRSRLTERLLADSPSTGVGDALRRFGSPMITPL